MDDDYTLDEITSNYGYYPTLPAPSDKTLQRWRKWLKNDFHVHDFRSGSSKTRPIVQNAILEEFAKEPSCSARNIAKATGYSISTVSRNLKKYGLHYGPYRKVPYKLTPEQRSKRDNALPECCKYLRRLKRTNYASVLTLDETPK